jgi:hypothetical protein
MQRTTHIPGFRFNVGCIPASCRALLFLLMLGSVSLRAQTTYTESFEGGFRPTGWSGTITSGSTYDWTQYGGSAHTGTYQAGFDSYDANAGDAATLITPAFNLCNSTIAHNVSFWLWRENSYSGRDDKVQVYINSSASLTGATLIGTAHRYNGTAPAAGNNTWSQFTFALPGTATTNYIIFKAVSAFGSSLYMDDVTWVTDPCASGLANDFCTGAITVTCPSTTAGNTITATTSGDPTTYCGVTPVAAGIWYKFIGTGQYVTASLCTGTSYNTTISIYSGSCATIGCIDGNDDACGTASSMSFATGVGTTYYIFVSGPTAADKGAFTLTITCSSPAVANDDCDNAIALTPTATCSAPTAGNTTNGTANFAGCTGNADDDIWYKFTATATSHEILVTPTIATFDPVVELFSGICTDLTSITCMNANGANVAENIVATGLTIGTVYYVRVFHFAVGAGGGTFNICVINPPAAPANNDCAGATTLTDNTSCITTAGTTLGATASIGTTACSGSNAADVWYKFVAANSSATITVAAVSSSMDPVVQLYSGACGSLTALNCADATLSGGTEVIKPVGLSAGTTYYIQVSDYLGGGYNFNICVAHPSGAPSNDAPCNAIALPTITTDCNYADFTTDGAANSSGGGIPTPSGCVSNGGGTSGGGSYHDVWFTFVAPSSGQVSITAAPVAYVPTTAGVPPIPDAVMAVYSGTCTAMVAIACNDDHNYPGTANDSNPFLNLSGLTPGTTYYLRYWAYSSSDDGPFGLCIQTTSNDNCSNALKICDLNGYSSSTNAAYTPDHPGSGATQMAGDCEYPSNPYPNPWPASAGTNSGYPFGQVDPWGETNVPANEGVSVFDVSIENNSWVSFVASGTKVTLTVTIGECYKSPAGGIQMQIFSTSGACSGFVPASPFYESATSFTVSANNLTAGTTYLLMIDGFAGDVCNYSINAGSGVQFPAITVSASPVCLGNSTTLTAPSGATSYSWTYNGATTQAVTVTPPTNATYTCVVGGTCGYKKTLTANVTVSSACAPLPIELLTFDALYKGGESAYLLWETATETNNGFFTIERSSDGQTFTEIGTTPSKAPDGNSTNPLKYRMIDLNVRTGMYYYRLKQTDRNGDFTYSGVATLQVNDGSTEFGIKPNPTSNVAEITYLALEDGMNLLKVYDYSGKVISSNEMFGTKGLNTATVSLGEQPPGIYFITLVANNKVYKTKLVKRNE